LWRRGEMVVGGSFLVTIVVCQEAISLVLERTGDARQGEEEGLCTKSTVREADRSVAQWEAPMPASSRLKNSLNESSVC